MYEDRALGGIVIDAGHGGNDPGAVNGVKKEKDYNLLVSKYMYERFKDLGIPVKLTREMDETLSHEERIKRALDAFGDSSNIVLLSNHINAGGGEGAEIVYALRNNDQLAKIVLEQIGKEGQIMRKYYQRRLPSDPSKDYYFIERETGNLTPLLIEYGFIDNIKDQKKLDNDILKYAEGVVRGVTSFYNVPYKIPGGIDIPSEVYVVLKGDSLYSIAIKLGTSIDLLKAANNLTSNILKIGQILNVPKPTPTPPTNEEFYVYIVKKGDSLYSIASKNNVRVDDIIRLNQLANTNLMINQQLLIPIGNIPVDSNFYIVKSGDSLYSIALKLNTTVDELIKINNLENTILQLNQKLLIPGKEPQEPPTPPTSEVEYIVSKGDSLYSIAKKYNITADKLKNYNKLKSSLLYIGQKLLIPESEKYITYYVKKGDNLYDLAIKYNTTVDVIKNLNNLTSNILNIDQLLILPA